MPNRILRDWTDSTTIDKLSASAEIFFVRLIMKADDYGCFHANSRLLLINLFPWKIQDIKEEDIEAWLKECATAGLIEVYEVDGKRFLMIREFNQTLRTKNRKFPPPPSESDASAKQMTSKGKTTASKKKADALPTAPKGKLFGTEYDELLNWMDEYAPILKRMKYPLTEAQYEKLREQYSVENIKELFLAIGNYRKVENYTNAYSTFIQWAKKQQWQSEINNQYANSNNNNIQEESKPNKWLERQLAGGR